MTQPLEIIEEWRKEHNIPDKFDEKGYGYTYIMTEHPDMIDAGEHEYVETTDIKQLDNGYQLCLVKIKEKEDV